MSELVAQKENKKMELAPYDKKKYSFILCIFIYDQRKPYMLISSRHRAFQFCNVITSSQISWQKPAYDGPWAWRGTKKRWQEPLKVHTCTYKIMEFLFSLVVSMIGAIWINKLRAKYALNRREEEMFHVCKGFCTYQKERKR